MFLGAIIDFGTFAFQQLDLGVVQGVVHQFSYFEVLDSNPLNYSWDTIAFSIGIHLNSKITIYN